MDLLFTHEQEAMVGALAKFLSSARPLELLHGADRPGQELGSLASDELWSGLAELGLFGLAVPEVVGGAGLGLADEVAVFRELGRHLTPGPVLGTVLAAHACAAAGRSELVEDLIEGRARASVAGRQPGTQSVVGERVSGTFRLHDLETCEWAVVVDGERVALVSAGDVVVDHVDGIDPTAPVVIGRLDSTAEVTVSGESIGLRASLLLAAILCGISEAARDDSASYVKIREQFGKPIGAFQGVKHRCAEMAVRSEVAFFQTVFGSLVVDEGREQPEFHAAAAMVVARDAAQQNAADNVQNHGGMGFTAEADAHLYVRRQLALRFLLGGNREHLETIAREDAMR